LAEEAKAEPQPQHAVNIAEIPMAPLLIEAPI